MDSNDRSIILSKNWKKRQLEELNIIKNEMIKNNVSEDLIQKYIDEEYESIEQKFNEKINATLAQVTGGYLSGVFHVIDLNKQKKYQGVMVPEDLPYKDIYNTMKPFYGEFIFTKVEDWDFNMKTRSITFRDYKEQAVNKNPEWKLKDFLINPETLGFEVPKTVVNKKDKDKEEKPDYEKKNLGVFQHGMGLERYNDKLFRMESYTKRELDKHIKNSS
jgi:hypothetical protein